MRKKNTIHIRSDPLLDKVLNDFAQKNNLNKVQATRELANIFKGWEGKKKIKRKIIRELRF